MNKGMTILYQVHNNLYVNLTNRCPCACTFCLRNNMETVSKEDSRTLWLEREPELEEIKAEFKKYDMSKFDEVVFCGYGEPTERLDILLQVAAFVKENFQKKIRVNTNGLADLIWQRDTSPDFVGLVDTISISLNYPDAEKYQSVVRSKFGPESFDAMLKFAKNIGHFVPNVVLTTVDTVLTKDEEEKCAQICKKIGAKYRI
ncbi:MAG: TIGR04100 family radical SAM protein, partial [Treponemataceae bacterium]|nr:TIGR04100 family radical SAM protein [Treponemataceae bacterium]